MREIFLGIDPGKYGAICIYSECGILEIIDIPLREVIGSNEDDRRREEVDSVMLYNNIIRQLRKHKIKKSEIICAHFEKVGGWKRDAASSAFSFGDSNGSIRTSVVLACGSETFEIYSYPQTWKNRLGLINNGKDGSITLALALTDQKKSKMSDYLHQKKDHDRAEAFLLAHLASIYYKEIKEMDL